MKKTIIFGILLFVVYTANSQNRYTFIKTNTNKNGIITSVEFPEKGSALNEAVPKNAENFFIEYLKISTNDHFVKVKDEALDQNEKVESFDQYYNGIQVYGGVYNFHYRNGIMFLAQGHYVKIENLETKPLISLENAVESFAKYYEIPLNLVNDYKAQLMICEIPEGKEIDLPSKPMLVYQIRLFSDHLKNEEFGYIEAHSGKVVLTSPVSLHIWTGTFATRYNGSQQANTDYYSSMYHLIDNTRGLGIHVRNLNEGTIPTYNESAEITDNDNNWTSSELHASETDMGLDTHWALQKIYDHLLYTYNKNSFDNQGFAINAYIHYGLKDESKWDPTYRSLFFGDGDILFSPLASLDVVAHEYGHAISHFQIGWAYTPTFAKFNEGMSDIWGAIFEQRIRPNNVWKIGEQVTLNYGCVRNLQSTGDANALQKIADTYLGATYNSSPETSADGIYKRGGVFSHWFYLLVNGGSGKNELQNSFTVNGIGMDKAEDLIVKAVYGGFLNGTTTYPEIRSAIVSAARSLCPNGNDLLVNQIENAWYAVGVGTQPTSINITGPAVVCSSGSTYTINNLPSNCTVTWEKSSNLTLSGTPNVNQAIFISNGIGEGWVMPTIKSTCDGSTFTTVKLTPLTIWVGKPTISVNSISNLQDMGYSNYYKILPASGVYDYEGTLTANVPILSDLIDSTWSFYSNMPNKKIAYWSASGYTVDVGAKSNNAGEVIKYTVTNNCGTTYSLFTFFTGDNTPPPPELIFTPNPASTQTEVIIPDNTFAIEMQTAVAIQKTYTISIMNSFGLTVYSRVGCEKKITVPTSTLKNGIYTVRVSNGTNIFQGNLVVNH